MNGGKMPKFEVGEIAIIQSKNRPQYNGQETEIVKPHTWMKPGPDYGRQAYICTIQHSSNGWFEEALRKRPPKEDARKWFDEKIKLNPKVLEEA